MATTDTRDRRVDQDLRGSQGLNLLGERFTRLLVIGETNKRNHREKVWTCLCDCGNTVEATTNRLRSGNTKSCGCYHKIRCREIFSIPDSDIRINRILYDYRKSARTKGRAFTLSRETVVRLVDADCYYCGAKPSNKLQQHGRILIYQGIDRLDNAKGYTPDNVVPCCIICNKMKKAMNEGDFLEHLHRITERHPKASVWDQYVVRAL